LNIQGIVQLEDCLDGTSIWELKIESALDEQFILQLGQVGRLDYYRHFPRPFFRLTLDDRAELKGVQGTNQIQLVLKRHLADIEPELVRIFQRPDIIKTFPPRRNSVHEGH
jgi:hypothetical protein